MKPDPWIDWYCGKEGEVEEEIPELEKILTMNNVVRILDLGRGTGRHTLYFARRGFKLWGLDQSEAAIERAKGTTHPERCICQPAEVGHDTHPLPVRELILRRHHCNQGDSPYNDDGHSKNNGRNFAHHKARRLVAFELANLRESPQAEKGGAKSDEVESGTFLPHEGEERGIFHHHFTEKELRKLVSGWNILDLYVRAERYILTAMKTA